MFNVKDEIKIVDARIFSCEFYVIDFDTKKHCANHSTRLDKVSLTQARAEFENRVMNNPNHINTMLGVNFAYHSKGNEEIGSVDLLQCVDGKVRLSHDYKKVGLENQSIIAINTVNILSRDCNELNELLENEFIIGDDMER